MVNMIKESSKLFRFVVASYVVLLVLQIIIWISGTTDAPQNHIWGFVYGGFSLLGAFVGLSTAKSWGGFKSLMGKAIVFLSLGLFAQGFGQYSFWFFNFVLKVAVPYPGIPDFGYFGTIPLYIFASYLLAKASGVKISLKSFTNASASVIIPVTLLGLSYFLFLRDYTFADHDALTIFLDFGYPMGHAVYISIAILTFILSRNVLGGIMQSKIMLLIVAFTFMYVSDYVFIYFAELYYPASFIDTFYLTAYFVMSLSLIRLKEVSDKLKSSNKK